jgi:hypothetical protein
MIMASVFKKVGMAEIALNVPLGVDGYRRADALIVAKDSTLFEEVQRSVHEYADEYDIDADGSVLSGTDVLDHMNAIIKTA